MPRNDDASSVERWEVQVRKGVLELAVLAALWSGRLYGLELIRRLEADARLAVAEGTLYPLLTRLKNSGLLEYKWVESKSGPPRKYYKLTDKGIKFLEKLTETWEELIHSTEMITSRSNTQQ